MQLLNYVRRCKKKTGSEKHKTLHAADADVTFCGKELNEMWFIHSSAGLEPEDVTCKACVRVMRAMDEANDKAYSCRVSAAKEA